jgi:flagellar biosynthesis protein FlhG
MTSAPGVLSIAITGSKGGVGKSNLAVNLGVALQRCGREVLLVDGDLGLSNLDVLLGLIPARTVADLLRGDAGLEELLLEGPAGVRILPAASGVPELTRLDPPLRERFLAALVEGTALADAVLVDTGAGVGETTVAMQLAASRVLLVTTPEPTSLVDAYASLKILWSADPGKRVDVVVNAVDDEAEGVRAYEQVARAATHFLGQAPGLLGSVYRDAKLQEAVRRQRSLLEIYPTSPAARCYERIALLLTCGDARGETSSDYWRRFVEASVVESLH